MAMLSLNSIWVLTLDVVHAQQIVPSALIKSRAIPVTKATPLTIGRELARTMYSVLQMLAFVLRASRKSLVPVVMRLLPRMGVVIMALECALEQMAFVVTTTTMNARHSITVHIVGNKAFALYVNKGTTKLTVLFGLTVSLHQMVGMPLCAHTACYTMMNVTVVVVESIQNVLYTML
jgi:hypothetical protein